MINRFLFATVLLAGSFTVASAQDFVLKADTMQKNTEGFTPITGACDDDAVFFYNYVKNNTANTLPKYNWRIISKDLPFGWYLCQLCDNNVCRPKSDAALNSPYPDVEASSVNAGDSGLIEPAIAVPRDGDNGVGILRLKVWSANTIDTATFIVNKTPVGISKIAVSDTRVNIYPNPANNTLLVYAEKSLNPANISIISITGQVVYNTTISPGKEAENISISSLTKGTYMVRLTDTKGQVLTSRKFVKE